MTEEPKEEPTRSILDVFAELSKTPEGRAKLEEFAQCAQAYLAAQGKLSNAADDYLERMGLRLGRGETP